MATVFILPLTKTYTRHNKRLPKTTNIMDRIRQSSLKMKTASPFLWNSGLRPPAFSSKIKQDERSEEHTSELQSRFDLVCRLLLEKKNMIAFSLRSSRN